MIIQTEKSFEKKLNSSKKNPKGRLDYYYLWEFVEHLLGGCWPVILYVHKEMVKRK